MDWAHYKEWIFSGVGVVLLVAVLQFVSKTVGFPSSYLRPREKDPITPDASALHEGLVQSVESGYHETPTPSEIIAAIDDAKPFLKDSVRKSYHGLRVRWTLRLSSTCKMSSGNQRGSIYSIFMLSGTQLHAVSVCFDVNIDRCPFLKTANVNEVFAVEGIIQDFPFGTVVRLRDIRTIQRVSQEHSVSPPASSIHIEDSWPRAG
jgi:hypothetical protein